MRTLVIAPKNDRGKGRTFRSELVAYVRAWDTGDWARPSWMLLAGTEGEQRAFLANLLGGRRATWGSGRHATGVELLRSAGYEVAVQREPEGCLATVFLPDLVRLDPGMVDKTGVRFLMVVPRSWIDKHGDQGVAMLFCAYLDRRTRAPIVADPKFCAQLYQACLGAGVAGTPVGPEHYREKAFGQSADVVAEGLEDAGVGLVVGCRCSHEAIETLLADEVVKFYAVREHRGARREGRLAERKVVDGSP